MRIKILAWLSSKLTHLHNILGSYSKLPWNTSMETLQQMNENSLGFKLFKFYEKNQFHPIPTMEYHDVDHILLDVDTDVKSEMLLQFFSWGNGKRTVFVFLACMGSLLILPEMWFRCSIAYQHGRCYKPIHHTDYRELLHLPLHEVRKRVLVPSSVYNYNVTPMAFRYPVFKNN